MGTAWRAAAAAMLVVALLGACAPARPRPQAGAGWEELRPPLPSGRGELAVALWRDGLVVAGGLSGLGVNQKDVRVYDLAHGRWRDLPDLPQPRHHLALAVVGDTLYAIGGARGLSPARATHTVFALDLTRGAGARWEERRPLPEPRAGHGAAAVGGLIYVVGGVAGPDRRAPAATYVYDPAADRWERAADLPTPREHLAVVALDGRVYAIGGRQGARNVAAVEAYDPAADRWQRRADLPTPRSGLAAAALGGRIHAVGGEDPRTLGGRTFRVHEVYDPAADRWRPAPPLPVPLHGTQAVAHGGALVLAGGSTRHGIASVLGWSDRLYRYRVRP